VAYELDEGELSMLLSSRHMEVNVKKFGRKVRWIKG